MRSEMLTPRSQWLRDGALMLAALVAMLFCCINANAQETPPAAAEAPAMDFRAWGVEQHEVDAAISAEHSKQAEAAATKIPVASEAPDMTLYHNSLRIIWSQIADGPSDPIASDAAFSTGAIEAREKRQIDFNQIVTGPRAAAPGKPVAYVYMMPPEQGRCPPCKLLHDDEGSLPVKLKPASPPSWVRGYPTIHWKDPKGEWHQFTGWSKGAKPKLESALNATGIESVSLNE